MILFFFAGTWLATTANAQPIGEESPFIDAFTSICLQELGNSRAQAAVALAPPWSFVADSTEKETYRSDAGRLGIFEADRSCTFTAQMNDHVTLQTTMSVMRTAIGTDEGQPLEDEDSRYWLIADRNGDEYVLALKVSSESGENLVTLWVQPRAALADE